MTSARGKWTRGRIIQLSLFALAALGLCAACASLAGSGGAGVYLRDPGVNEASGMVVSPTDEDFLWLVNDSGNSASLFLADRTGAARGSLLVKGALNRDWEDLAAFRRDGKAWLVIGDIGDNRAEHPAVILYFVPEPVLPKAGEKLRGTAEGARKLVVRYPDGPRDCESLAVAGDWVYLLSKRDVRPRLYRVPLDSGKAEVTAEFLGETAVPEAPPGAPFVVLGKWPTALDISTDGKLAVILTYRGTFLARRAAGESWAAAMARPLEWLGPHHLHQAECAAFTPDGRQVLVTSEGAMPELVTLPVPELAP